jgi:hypothetical protein
MGLDVSPTPGVSGVHSAFMSRDYKAIKAGGTDLGWRGTLYWYADTDDGLASAIDAAITADDPYPIWVDHSCLWPTTNPFKSGNEYSCSCYNQIWGTPNQIISLDNEQGLELKRVCNVPLDITGRLAKLHMIHWDADMQAQYEAMV